MPKDPKEFIDWNSPGGKPAHKAHNIHKGPPHPVKDAKIESGKGEDVLANQLAKMMLDKGVLKHPKQPTDEEMFGHLVVSPEELKKKEENWNNFFNTYFKELMKPIESQKPSQSWGRGPINKEDRTEEELRISAIPVDESLLKDD